jgi:hypothetical protein
MLWNLGLGARALAETEEGCRVLHSWLKMCHPAEPTGDGRENVWPIPWGPNSSSLAQILRALESVVHKSKYQGVGRGIVGSFWEGVREDPLFDGHDCPISMEKFGAVVAYPKDGRPPTYVGVPRELHDLLFSIARGSTPPLAYTWEEGRIVFKPLPVVVQSWLERLKSK